MARYLTDIEKLTREFWTESYVWQVANADSYLQVNHLSRSRGVGVLSRVQDGDPTTGHLLLKEAYHNQSKHIYLFVFLCFLFCIQVQFIFISKHKI